MVTTQLVQAQTTSALAMPDFTLSIVDGRSTWSYAAAYSMFSICFMLIVVYVIIRTRAGEFGDGIDGAEDTGTIARTSSDAAGDTSTRNRPTKAEPGLQILHDCNQPSIE
jgi:hypothetical protein